LRSLKRLGSTSPPKEYSNSQATNPKEQEIDNTPEKEFNRMILRKFIQV
jgi:hypothetical protein